MLVKRVVLVVFDQDLTSPQYVESMKRYGDQIYQHFSKMLMPEYLEIALSNSRIANAKLDDCLLYETMSYGISCDWYRPGNKNDGREIYARI